MQQHQLIPCSESYQGGFDDGYKDAAENCVLGLIKYAVEPMDLKQLQLFRSAVLVYLNDEIAAKVEQKKREEEFQCTLRSSVL